MSDREIATTSTPANPGTRKKAIRSQKRQEEFRRKKGNETQNAYKANLESKYAIDPSILSKMANHVTSSVPVPVSTRGIGFAIVNHYSAARARNVTLRVSPTAAYRVSHAQLYAKAASVRPALLDPPETVPEPPLDIAYDVGQAITVDSNFSLVSEVINSLGNVERHQCHYRSQLVLPPILPLPGKEEQSYMFPDPFNVNYANLEPIVSALANPLVPNAARASFRSHNPIPGAIWDDNNILTNPLDIWPAGYDASALAGEMSEFSAMMSLIRQKVPHWVGKLENSHLGVGKLGIIPTLTKHTEGSWQIVKVADAAPDLLHAPGKFSSSSPVFLEPLDLLMANVTMLGELPPADYVRMRPDTYGFRNYRVQGQTAEFVRAGLVDQLLST